MKSKTKVKYVAGCPTCEKDRRAIPIERIREAAKILGCTTRELKAALRPETPDA